MISARIHGNKTCQHGSSHTNDDARLSLLRHRRVLLLVFAREEYAAVKVLVPFVFFHFRLIERLDFNELLRKTGGRPELQKSNSIFRNISTRISN